MVRGIDPSATARKDSACRTGAVRQSYLLMMVPSFATSEGNRFVRTREKIVPLGRFRSLGARARLYLRGDHYADAASISRFFGGPTRRGARSLPRTAHEGPGTRRRAASSWPYRAPP